MKDKIITIKPKKRYFTKQWSILLLELNIMKKAWKPYGVNIQMSAPGLKRIVDWGTKNMELIILNDGLYHLVPVTKQMMEGIVLTED